MNQTQIEDAVNKIYGYYVLLTNANQANRFNMAKSKLILDLEAEIERIKTITFEAFIQQKNTRRIVSGEIFSIDGYYYLRGIEKPIVGFSRAKEELRGHLLARVRNIKSISYADFQRHRNPLHLIPVRDKTVFLTSI